MADRRASTQVHGRQLARHVLGVVRKSSSGYGLTLAVGAMAILCLLLALWVMPPRFSAAHVLVVVAAILTLAAVLLAFRTQTTPVHKTRTKHSVSIFGERLERQIEQLQDVQWALSEDEARLRDLLDAQDDMILRRDTSGRLTFVNKAFCNAFGIEAAQVLGSTFTPPILERVQGPEIASCNDLDRPRSLELVETTAGPRWICWETSRLISNGPLAEIQILGRDVTVERAADAALTDARDRAEAANRAKSRFLAAMSHEIRTPMNGILGMAGLLRDTPLALDQETYVRAIDQSARNLLALINEILDFSKIEAGKLVLTRAPFCLAETVQGAVELMAPLAEEKGLEIAWLVEPECRGCFMGDEARLRQILLNLISNAIKFTDHGGISVTVVRGGQDSDDRSTTELNITVTDTGIGLTDSDLAMIFAEFEQADAAIMRQRGGTGLGLAISMQLARAMQGSIRVASTPGAGSTFTLSLGLEAVTSPLQISEPVRKIETTAVNVLLACDRALERQALATHLDEAGLPYVVSEAKDALNAIGDASQRAKPITHLIVEGEGDPVRAGQILERAKNLAHPLPVKGLVLISPIARDGLAAFRREGFTGYLVRPVRPLSMIEQLTSTSAHAHNPAAKSKSVSALDTIGPSDRRRVLLAEDNAVNRLLATRILERAGCDIEPASNGLEAVTLVRQSIETGARPFSLILMDMRMPQLDGLEACAAIRELFSLHPHLICPPIVAITANAFAEDRLRCLEGGMDDYLAKPFDGAQLKALLEKWSRFRKERPAA